MELQSAPGGGGWKIPGGIKPAKVAWELGLSLVFRAEFGWAGLLSLGWDILSYAFKAL